MNKYTAAARDSVTSNLATSKLLLEHELSKAFFHFMPDSENHQKEYYNVLDCIFKDIEFRKHFKFVASGCYKETYKLNDDFVIKLCCQDNDTASERALLDLAKEAGLGDIFVDTQFVHLFGNYCDMPVLLEEGDALSGVDYDSDLHTFVDDPDWDGRYAADLEIQPRVTRFVYNCDEPFWDYAIEYKEDYPEYEPLCDPTTGEVVSYDTVYALGICSRHWLQCFLDNYGIQKLRDFAAFVSKYEVNGLHNHNLGYFKGRPVVLDWMSPNASRLSAIQKAADLH